MVRASTKGQRNLPNNRNYVVKIDKLKISLKDETFARFNHEECCSRSSGEKIHYAVTGRRFVCRLYIWHTCEDRGRGGLSYNLLELVELFSYDKDKRLPNPHMPMISLCSCVLVCSGAGCVSDDGAIKVEQITPGPLGTTGDHCTVKQFGGSW